MLPFAIFLTFAPLPIAGVCKLISSCLDVETSGLLPVAITATLIGVVMNILLDPSPPGRTDPGLDRADPDGADRPAAEAELVKQLGPKPEPRYEVGEIFEYLGDLWIIKVARHPTYHIVSITAGTRWIDLDWETLSEAKLVRSEKLGNAHRAEDYFRMNFGKKPKAKPDGRCLVVYTEPDDGGARISRTWDSEEEARCWMRAAELPGDGNAWLVRSDLSAVQVGTVEDPEAVRDTKRRELREKEAAFAAGGRGAELADEGPEPAFKPQKSPPAVDHYLDDDRTVETASGRVRVEKGDHLIGRNLSVFEVRGARWDRPNDPMFDVTRINIGGHSVSGQVLNSDDVKTMLHRGVKEVEARRKAIANLKVGDRLIQTGYHRVVVSVDHLNGKYETVLPGGKTSDAATWTAEQLLCSTTLEFNTPPCLVEGDRFKLTPDGEVWTVGSSSGSTLHAKRQSQGGFRVFSLEELKDAIVLPPEAVIPVTPETPTNPVHGFFRPPATDRPDTRSPQDWTMAQLQAIGARRGLPAGTDRTYKLCRKCDVILVREHVPHGLGNGNTFNPCACYITGNDKAANHYRTLLEERGPIPPSA